MKAWITRFGTAWIGMYSRRSRAYSATSDPSAACTRVITGGS